MGYILPGQTQEALPLLRGQARHGLALQVQNGEDLLLNQAAPLGGEADVYLPPLTRLKAEQE